MKGVGWPKILSSEAFVVVPEILDSHLRVARVPISWAS